MTGRIFSEVKQDCMPHLGKKLVIFCLLFLVAWNATKIPFYIAFDSNGDSDYEKGGLTGQINLHYWIKGYTSAKLHSPACNFVLVHVAIGSTVLIMMAMTLVKKSWRRKYGYYFFSFAILLGTHTLPASWNMPQLPLRILFLCTCALVMVNGALGLRTLANYERDPVKAEKDLAMEYTLITLGSYGAGFAEFTFMYFKIKYRVDNGVYHDYGPDPEPVWGHTIYDWLPERVGMTVFFAWVALVWFWWPIKILGVDGGSSNSGASTETGDELEAGETTPLVKSSLL